MLIFAVKKYADSLTKVADRKNINRHWNQDLIKIDADKKEATFKDIVSGEMEYTITLEVG